MVSVLSEEAVDGADADTLLTTEETMERSTSTQVSHGAYVNPYTVFRSASFHLLLSGKASSLGPGFVFASKSA